MTRLIHITDLHFWRIVYNPIQLFNKRILGNLNLLLRRRRYIHTERAPSFLETLSQLRPDGILVGGDLTTTSTTAEFQQAVHFLDQVSALCPSVYLLPGNHDCYTYEACRNRRFERYCGAYAPATDTPVLSPLSGSVSLLRIPTVRPNLISSRGYISQKQLDQTAKFLETSPTQFIALSHYPILDSTADYDSGYNRRLIHAHQLRNVLGQSKQSILYLSGHVHVFTHTRDPHYQNITHITTSALFYDKGRRHGGFTEIELDAGEIRIFPWHYQDGWVRGQASHPGT